MPRRTGLFLLVIAILGISAVDGQMISLDQLTLDPPTGTTNRLSISLQTSIGNDSDVAVLTRSTMATLHFNLPSGPTAPTGFAFTGGDISASDLQFNFLFGLVTISTTGVGGTPSTLNPPSAIVNGSFDAADHEFTLNRGTISAPGTLWNLTDSPITAAGTGQGTFNVSLVASGIYEAELRLPVEFNQPFEINDVPVVGTVTGSIVGSGTIVARQQFPWTALPGDYDFDGTLGCSDIDLLQQEILAGSTNLFFDVNGDGQVSMPDYQAWVTDLKGSILGDANLDMVVDGSDFSIWNANKFTQGHGWCEADFTGERAVDGSDFSIWNAHKFTAAAPTDAVAVDPPRTVPEPSGLGWAAGILGFMYTKVRLTKVHVRH